jgi:hypothetical protein
VVLSVKDDVLIVQSESKGGFPTTASPPTPNPPPALAALIGKDLLMILEGPGKDQRTEFLRDATGKILWLLWGGRLLPKQN